jgi:hypothetical protein
MTSRGRSYYLAVYVRYTGCGETLDIAVVTKYPESCIAAAYDFSRCVHDTLEQSIKLKFTGDGNGRAVEGQQLLDAPLRALLSMMLRIGLSKLCRFTRILALQA